MNVATPESDSTRAMGKYNGPYSQSVITLVHPYSRIKSDKEDCLFFIPIFDS